MLLSFGVENFLSFKERNKLDFNGGKIKELQHNVFNNIPNFPDDQILKCLALYGSNSSGKSNVIKAFAVLRNLVLNSSKESQANAPIDVESFRLSEQTEKLPTKFEIEFILDNTKYFYGVIAYPSRIVSEWLFVINKRKKLETIFIRENEMFDFHKGFKSPEVRSKIKMLSEITRPNALFLSVLAQFNVDIGWKISQWFAESEVIFDTYSQDLIDYTASLLSQNDFNARINHIIRNSDLGITAVDASVIGTIASIRNLMQVQSSYILDQPNTYRVSTLHKKFNLEKHVSYEHFDLLKNESLGTQKFFGLLGPIMMSLKKGTLLWIDEIDSSFHTLMLEMVAKLFNSVKNNPNGAQLVCTLHNTDPLRRLLRRDQMVFFEKDHFGASTFCSLYQKAPKVRNDASFEKDYLLGKYGGIPKINSQLDLFGSLDSPQDE